MAWKEKDETYYRALEVQEKQLNQERLLRQKDLLEK